MTMSQPADSAPPEGRDDLLRDDPPWVRHLRRVPLPLWTAAATAISVVVATVLGATEHIVGWISRHNPPIATRCVLAVSLILTTTAAVVDQYRLNHALAFDRDNRQGASTTRAIERAKEVRRAASTHVVTCLLALAIACTRLVTPFGPPAAFALLVIVICTHAAVAEQRQLYLKAVGARALVGFRPMLAGPSRQVLSVASLLGLRHKLLRRSGPITVAALALIGASLCLAVASAQAEVAADARRNLEAPVSFPMHCSEEAGRDRFYKGDGPINREPMATVWWNVGKEAGGCPARSPERHGAFWVVWMHSYRGAMVVGSPDGTATYLKADAAKELLPRMESGELSTITERIRNYWGDTYIATSKTGQCAALVRNFGESYTYLQPAVAEALFSEVGDSEAGFHVTSTSREGLRRTGYTIEIVKWVGTNRTSTRRIRVHWDSQAQTATHKGKIYRNDALCDQDLVEEIRTGSRFSEDPD